MAKEGFVRMMISIAITMSCVIRARADDTNHVFHPCEDAKIQRSDGFTFGIAFSSITSFFDQNQVQLSPCDKRLSLSTTNAELALFRPKVDEISLLTINTSASFSPVLEFQKGTLQNLYWKRDGCASCSGHTSFVCLNGVDCAIRYPSCKNQGGTVDCSLGIQLAFSGTDKHDSVLNSWYEVSNLRQYSLYGLYENLKDSLTSGYNKFF